MTKLKDCICTCHSDSNIRHETIAEICCEKPTMYSASQACNCKIEPWHAGCAIDPHFLLEVNGARITDTKGHVQMEQLKKYTGVVMFRYDPKTKSLDIHFKRGICEWNDGAGIQINGLTETDKQSILEYIKCGN